MPYLGNCTELPGEETGQVVNRDGALIGEIHQDQSVQANSLLVALEYILAYNTKDINDHGATSTNHLIDVCARAAIAKATEG